MSATSTKFPESWSTHFPQLCDGHDDQFQQTMARAKTMRFPANQQVSSPGMICEHYILVVEGSLRVQIMTNSGREVVLYHVHPGDGCILTTTCLLSGDRFPAEGITDKPTEVIAMTTTDFDQALQESARFRQFVFTNVGQRLADVITRIEQLCSPAIDRHLADILLKFTTGSTGSITTTHQELATELGTAREVVSRHLKQFELHGWVQLGRGTIHILMPDVLSRMSQKE